MYTMACPTCILSNILITAAAAVKPTTNWFCFATLIVCWGLGPPK